MPTHSQITRLPSSLRRRLWALAIITGCLAVLTVHFSESTSYELPDSVAATAMVYEGPAGRTVRPVTLEERLPDNDDRGGWPVAVLVFTVVDIPKHGLLRRWGPWWEERTSRVQVTPVPSQTIAAGQLPLNSVVAEWARVLEADGGRSTATAALLRAGSGRSERVVWSSVAFALLDAVLAATTAAGAVMAIFLFRRLVRIRRGRECPACGYSLAGLPADRCPECGTIVRPDLAGGASA